MANKSPGQVSSRIQSSLEADFTLFHMKQALT